MRSVIPDLLWLGNAQDVRDVRAVLSAGVQAVVDLAANETPVQYPRDIVDCRFPLNDGSENEPVVLRLTISTAAEFLKAKVPTLVACSAGMSRSPAVAAAAIAIVEQRPPDEVLRQIAAKGPHDVSPSLWSEIMRIVFASEPAWNGASNRPSLNLVVLKTHQMDTTLEFYRALGIDFVAEQHGKGPVHYAAVTGSVVLELYPAKEDDAVDTTMLGFDVLNSLPSIDALRSIGTTIISEPKSTQWGRRAAVRDPDGRAVELRQRTLRR